MKSLFFVGLLAAVVFVLDSAPSHSGHNQMEHDTVNFYYEPNGNYLVGQTMSSCFLAKLTKDEQDHVHTNRGMEDLELLMLRDMLGKLNETHIYHDGTLPGNIQNWCSHRDLYLLERPLEVITTAISLIG